MDPPRGPCWELMGQAAGRPRRRGCRVLSPAHLLHPRPNTGARRVHALGRAAAGGRQHRRQPGGLLPRRGSGGRLGVGARHKAPLHTPTPTTAASALLTRKWPLPLV